MNAQPDLQAQIAALADFPVKPAATWVMRVRSSPVEVIAGAILTWSVVGGISGFSGDPMEARRAAAQAILQARLSEQTVNSTSELRDTIDDYQRKSGRQTTVMLWLTVVIAALTVVQIWIALRGAASC